MSTEAQEQNQYDKLRRRERGGKYNRRYERKPPFLEMRRVENRVEKIPTFEIVRRQ